MKRLWLGKEAHDRRTRILAAAIEVFAEEGFRTAEVKTVAERAGVGKATIYKHFKSKDDLLLVIVEENLAYLRDLALQNLVTSGEPLERLEKSTRAMAGYIQANRSFSRVLIQEAGEFMGDIQVRYLALVEQNLPLADAFFETLRAQGYFKALPTRESVQLMLNQMIGLCYSWALSDKQTDLVDTTVAAVRVLVAGLSSEPDVIQKGLNVVATEDDAEDEEELPSDQA